MLRKRQSVICAWYHHFWGRWAWSFYLDALLCFHIIFCIDIFLVVIIKISLNITIFLSFRSIVLFAQTYLDDPRINRKLFFMTNLEITFRSLWFLIPLLNLFNYSVYFLKKGFKVLFYWLGVFSFIECFHSLLL